jgi:prophage minor tail protein Z (GPZ)
MKQFKVSVSNTALSRAESALEEIPRAFQKALPRAINRTLISGRVIASKAAAEKFSVKPSEVKKACRIIKASNKKPEGELRLSGSNLPLRSFAHTPRSENTTGARRKQVSVSISRSRREVLNKGFKWRGHIFERTGIRKATKANPRVHETIKKRYGPSVVAMVGNQAEKVQDRMNEMLQTRLDHEVNAILEGKAK